MFVGPRGIDRGRARGCADLVGVGPIDVVSYAAAARILALVTIAATFLPARRARSIDPVEALRAE